MVNKNIKLILVGLLVLLVIGLQNTTKKESVAAIEGQACVRDKHCPCWGEYTYEVGTVPAGEETTYGIGVGQCIDCNLAKYQNRTACEVAGSGLACDMTWCVDVEPGAEWLREHPWEWLQENPLITFAIIGLILLLIFWPKV